MAWQRMSPWKPLEAFQTLRVLSLQSEEHIKPLQGHTSSASFLLSSSYWDSINDKAVRVWISSLGAQMRILCRAIALCCLRDATEVAPGL